MLFAFPGLFPSLACAASPAALSTRKLVWKAMLLRPDLHLASRDLPASDGGLGLAAAAMAPWRTAPGFPRMLEAWHLRFRRQCGCS